ncbi:Urease accessory protein UreF OS=Streptomyces tendae OX=1932 GN=ureF PE=3 SV=1 [Streptomyces tendae]
MSRAALLVLADGRFPAGGHAHSGGAEAAVRAGRITDAASLEAFCRGRLHTSGVVAACVAAAAALGADPGELDRAADARTASPALRVTARRLGRQLMRAARATWPSPELDALAASLPKGAHQPVVLGLAARAAGLGALDAAYCSLYRG